MACPHEKPRLEENFQKMRTCVPWKKTTVLLISWIAVVEIRLPKASWGEGCPYLLVASGISLHFLQATCLGLGEWEHLPATQALYRVVSSIQNSTWCRMLNFKLEERPSSIHLVSEENWYPMDKMNILLKKKGNNWSHNKTHLMHTQAGSYVMGRLANAFLGTFLVLPELGLTPRVIAFQSIAVFKIQLKMFSEFKEG